MCAPRSRRLDLSLILHPSIHTLLHHFIALRDAEPDGSMWFAVEHLASVSLPSLHTKPMESLQMVKVCVSYFF